MKKSLLSLALAIALPTTFQVCAALQQNDLFDLSLEELSDVTINSVALRQQSPRDSAALVTVITRDMLDSYPVSSLAQALQLLPGFRVLQRTTFNQTYSSIRGMSVNDNDKHLLILIDGIPVRVNSSGGSNRLLYESFPVIAVERIEFIQGQAATLYGSNAVNAVVNIITRAVNGARYEWHDGAAGGGFGQKIALGEGHLEFLLNRQRSFSHWDHSGIKIPSLLSGDLTSRGDSLVTRWRQSDFHGQLILLDGRSTTISSLFAATPGSDLKDKTVLARFGSQQQLINTNNIIWSWDFAFDRTDIDYSTVQGDSRELYLNSSLKGELFQNGHWIMGASLLRAEGELTPLLTQWSTREKSAFFQIGWDLTESLEIATGFNWQQVHLIEADTTPQASLVWKVNDLWRLKLLYGESFRNADPRERFSNNRTQRGDPNLTPERGSQSTAAINFQNEQWQFQIAVFDQKLQDVISLVRLADQSRVFQNIGTSRSRGAQLEFHWQFDRDWLMEGTYTHLFSYESLVEPAQLSGLGVRFQGSPDWSASFRLDFASAGRYSTEQFPVLLNPEPASSLSANAALRFKLDRLCHMCPTDTQLTLSALNVGNSKDWQVATVTVNTLPARPERSWAIAIYMPMAF